MTSGRSHVGSPDTCRAFLYVAVSCCSSVHKRRSIRHMHDATCRRGGPRAAVNPAWCWPGRGLKPLLLTVKPSAWRGRKRPESARPARFRSHRARLAFGSALARNLSLAGLNGRLATAPLPPRRPSGSLGVAARLRRAATPLSCEDRLRSGRLCLPLLADPPFTQSSARFAPRLHRFGRVSVGLMASLILILRAGRFAPDAQDSGPIFCERVEASASPPPLAPTKKSTGRRC